MLFLLSRERLLPLLKPEYSSFWGLFRTQEMNPPEQKKRNSAQASGCLDKAWLGCAVHILGAVVRNGLAPPICFCAWTVSVAFVLPTVELAGATPHNVPIWQWRAECTCLGGLAPSLQVAVNTDEVAVANQSLLTPTVRLPCITTSTANKRFLFPSL